MLYLSLDQISQPLSQVMPADERGVPHVQMQPDEDDFGQGVLDGTAAPPVEPLRIAEQFQGCQEELPPSVEFGRGVGQLSLDLAPLHRDGRQLLLDLLLRPARLTHQVEVLLFLGVQLTQTSGQALLEAIDAAEFVEHGVVELMSYLIPELVTETHGGVVLLDRPLNVLHLEVRLVAGVLLSSPAHEVEVGAAVALARHDDEPFAAAAAPDQPFEPVVVPSGAGTTTAAQSQHSLYPIEQLSRHQRRVPSLVLFALVADEAEVVAVRQNVVELAQ